MKNTDDPYDVSGLIHDAYSMPDIDASQCRSIFLDWALKLPADVDPATAIRILLARHSPTQGDPYGPVGHPMDGILKAGLAGVLTPERRGGASGRRLFH